MIIFSLFHSPGDRGWLYCSFIRLRLEITSFHSSQASGGGTACRFYRSREPGHLVPSGLHGDSRSRSQTVLDIEFITICFPNHIYMMVTKASQNPN